MCRQWFPGEEEGAGFSVSVAKFFTYWHPLSGVLNLLMHANFTFYVTCLEAVLGGRISNEKA